MFNMCSLRNHLQQQLKQERSEHWGRENIQQAGVPSTGHHLRAGFWKRPRNTGVTVSIHTYFMTRLPTEVVESPSLGGFKRFKRCMAVMLRNMV